MNDEQLIASKLAHFDEGKAEYKAEKRRLVKALKTRFKADGILFHQIKGRVKKRDSLEEKLHKNASGPIHDFVGVRIILFFSEDIAWAENLVREVVEVNETTYVNKSHLLDNSSFGYKSVQFVATLPPAPSLNAPLKPSWILDSLPAWMDAKPGTAEVQIRTVLVHAWAEIDHELVYKANVKAADTVKRRLARTAALLESADEQFDIVRDEDSLARSGIIPVKRLAPVHRGEGGDFVPQVVQAHRESIQLDNEIRLALDLPMGRPEQYVREVSNAAHFAGWKSFEELTEALDECHTLARRMAIVCTASGFSSLLPDNDNAKAQPRVAFPGIGIYWLGLAIGAPLGSKRPDKFMFPSMNSVRDGRLAEYAVVSDYLAANRDVSALLVRDRYKQIAAPLGAKHFAPISFTDLI